MSKEELRRLLVDAAPDALPPTDRWTRVAGRVRRRRRQRVAVAAVVAVLSVGTATAALLPSAHGGPDLNRPAPAASAASVAATASGAPEPHVSYESSPSASRPPGLAYDAAKIPAGSPGSPAARVVRTGELPTSTVDGNGIFRTVCLYSHMNNDDPIANPGQPRASYLHMYWGNTKVTANSTPASVASSGNGTCRGGTVDRSAYWVPALIDTKTGAPLAPEMVHVFYESGYLGVRPDQIQAMPAGLRMVAGDATASSPQPHAGWVCWEVDRRAPVAGTIPRSCPASNWIALELYFPQCWNGHDLDSPDHRSHLAYSVVGRGCPATHPVALPQISYHVLYPAGAGTDTSGWRLASDTYRAAPGGYAVQGGWINGWSADITSTWIQGCVRIAATCGSHMLGDGRVLQGDK